MAINHAWRAGPRPHRLLRSDAASLGDIDLDDGGFLRLRVPNQFQKAEGEYAPRRCTNDKMPRRLGTDGLQTHRWREMDSNYWFRYGETPLGARATCRYEGNGRDGAIPSVSGAGS